MSAKTKAQVYYVHEWCEKADIDYFSAFVRAYIPFNAWMNEHYPNETIDRAIINKIKTTPNTFRDKLKSLLGAQTQQGTEFRVSIASLHNALEDSALTNNGEKLPLLMSFFVGTRNMMPSA